MGSSPAATQFPMFANRRILVVEDEGITQMQLHKILKRAGFDQVGSALNGEQGVEIALRERPEIILMDINMPGAFNGLEASRRILAAYSVCIVILTAYADHVEEAKAIGTCGYIVKPLDGQTLLPQLRDALEHFDAKQTRD